MNLAVTVSAQFACLVGEGEENCDTADRDSDETVDHVDVGFVQVRSAPRQERAVARARNRPQLCTDWRLAWALLPYGDR